MDSPDKTTLIIGSLGVPPTPVTMTGAREATIRELITDREGAPTFAMRLFELAPGGHTPQHSHPHEHEVYVLAGKGELRRSGQARPIQAADAVFVPGGAEHQFVNVDQGPLRFLCLIPVEKKCSVAP